MKRVEALVDAIAAFNGFRDPDCDAYKMRNPLMLRNFENGIMQKKMRRFGSLLHGYQAAIFDLQVKCSGKSRAKLEPDTLQGLMRVYSLPDGTAGYVARFLRKALNDAAISEHTELRYFVNGER